MPIAGAVIRSWTMHDAPIGCTPASSVRRRISDTSAIAWNVAIAAVQSKLRAAFIHLAHPPSCGVAAIDVWPGVYARIHVDKTDREPHAGAAPTTFAFADRIGHQRRAPVPMPCLRINSKNARRGLPAERAARAMLPSVAARASSRYLRSNSAT